MTFAVQVIEIQKVVECFTCITRSSPGAVAQMLKIYLNIENGMQN